MLDLRTQFARDLVEEMDDKRRHRHERVRRWLAILPAAGTAGVLWATFPDVFATVSAPFALDRLLFLAVLGLGYMWLFGQLRPFRSMLGVLREVALEDAD